MAYPSSRATDFNLAGSNANGAINQAIGRLPGNDRISTRSDADYAVASRIGNRSAANDCGVRGPFCPELALPAAMRQWAGAARIGVLGQCNCLPD